LAEEKGKKKRGKDLAKRGGMGLKERERHSEIFPAKTGKN